MERIIDVYYGRDNLPYKDEARTIHFPVAGSEFLGASQTTTIRFHYEQIGTDENVYTVESKRPDGKPGSQLLSKNTTEHYAEMSLSGWYSECKGDLFLSLKVYRGGTTATYNETTQLWEVSGIPVVESTGAIKLAINYTPMGRYENYNDAVETFQKVLAALGDKLDTIKGIVGVSGLSQVDTTEYEEGQLFFDVDTKNIYKLEGGEFVKINNKLEIVDVSGYEYEELFAMFGTQPFMSYFEETTNISIYQFKQSGDDYALYVWTYKDGCLYMPYVDMSAIFSIDDFTNLEYESAPVVEISSASGTLSDLDYEKVLQPNASLKLGDLYFIKAYEDDNLIEFWHYNVGHISSNSYVGYHNISISKQNKYYRLGSVEELFYDKTKTDQLLNAKQNELHSGTNIKTINGESLLGSGNIDIQGGSGDAEWGSIGGDIAEQTDLQNEFQNIREVAEGKCKTYVLNASTETVDSDFYDRYSRFVGGEITPFDSKQEMDDWLEEERRAVINPVFKSQENVIVLTPRGITSPTANFEDYFVVSSQNISSIPNIREFILITLSNVLLEQLAFKLGDNLYITNTEYPDRWVGLVYNNNNARSSGIVFRALETQKVDLTTYATKSETSTEVNKVAHDIAVEYDESTLYGIGDLCIKDKLLYKCNTADTTGTWDISKWDLTTVNSELGVIKGDIQHIANKFVGSYIGDETTFSTEMNVGDIIMESTGGQFLINEITFSGSTLTKVVLVGLEDNGNPVVHKFESGAWSSSNYVNSAIATLRAGTFNVINGSDILNNTLTQEQFDLIINGKPTLIMGNFLNGSNTILFPPYNYVSNYDGFMLRITASANQYCDLTRYNIVTSSKVISQMSTNKGFGIQLNRFWLKGLTDFNNKIVPDYPSDTTKQYKLVQQIGGTLAWVEDV